VGELDLHKEKEMENRIDFSQFGNFTSGNSADVDFIIEFAKDMQAKGDLSDSEIMRQVLHHMCVESNFANFQKVGKANRQVHDGLRSLKDLARWNNLWHAAQDAMELAKEIINDDEELANQIGLSFEVRLAVLTAGSQNFPSIFKEEFLASMISGKLSINNQG
jgi:hypothetical protein